MGGGLAFLSKKRFNPSNFSNRALVWEAKQKADLEERKTKERLEQLKREREDEELARALGGKVSGDAHQLKFMYDAPPGLSKKDQQKEDGERKPSGTEAYVKQEDHGSASCPISGVDNFLSYESHPGDDDAAAEFRRMLQRGSEQNIYNNNLPRSDGTSLQEKRESQSKNDKDNEGNADSSKPDTRTKLEKEAGKSIQGKAVTLKEQFERFPQLKNAPIAEGISVDNAHVAFKPMGETLRNVRCLKCGVWGHSVGDRECKLTGWNPFQIQKSTNATRRQSEKSDSHLRPNTLNGRGSIENQYAVAISSANMDQECSDPGRVVPTSGHSLKKRRRQESHRGPDLDDSSASDVSSISSHDVSSRSSDEEWSHKRRRRDRKEKKKRRKDRHRHRSSRKKDRKHKKHRKESRDRR